MSKCRKVLEDAVNATSTKKGLRAMKHSIVAYQQTKKGLSYFYPKRIVVEDGIHTLPMKL